MIADSATEKVNEGLYPPDIGDVVLENWKNKISSVGLY
jgi:hypothetical protein